MDSDQFDALTQWTADKVRRRGLLGTITTIVVSSIATPKVAGKRKGCTRDWDCLSGYCEKKRKKKRAKGSCQCRELNQTCRIDHNCCHPIGQPMGCIGGTCQNSERCVPRGGDCSASSRGCCTDSDVDTICLYGETCRSVSHCRTVFEAVGCQQGYGDPPSWYCESVDLRGADLRGCYLSNSGIRLSDLSGADMTGAYLHPINLYGSNLAGINWSNTTCPTGINSDDNGGTCCGAFGNPGSPPPLGC